LEVDHFFPGVLPIFGSLLL